MAEQERNEKQRLKEERDLLLIVGGIVAVVALGLCIIGGML